jgi:hypothetical protein
MQKFEFLFDKIEALQFLRDSNTDGIICIKDCSLSLSRYRCLLLKVLICKFNVRIVHYQT